METQTFTFKIPKDLNEQLNKIAIQEDRSKAYLIKKFLRKFIEAEERNKK